MTSAIGIFDSGVGGLTVARAIKRRLPNVPIMYLGDTARVPYGSKSEATVQRYALQVGRFLLHRGATRLVIGCHTASAFALEALESALEVPVHAVIDPSVEEASRVTRTGVIGVLSTLGTARSGAYRKSLAKRSEVFELFSQSCPLLVSLAEEGWISHSVTHQVAEHYLMGLRESSRDVDTIILGCTHFPLLREVLKEHADATFGRPVQLIDPAETLAEQLGRALDRQEPRASSQGDLLMVTDVSRFDELVGRFWGENAPPIQHVELSS